MLFSKCRLDDGRLGTRWASKILVNVIELTTVIVIAWVQPNMGLGLAIPLQ